MADLFSDGFESGDLSAWDDSETDSGDLSAHADAALHGSYGAKLVIDDTNSIYVQDNTPSGESRYRLRFYIDINSLSMGEGDEFRVFTGQDEGWGGSPYTIDGLIINLKYTSSTYKIYVSAANDSLTLNSSSEYTVTDDVHYIETDWSASSAPGEDDGFISLYIDGALKETVSGVDNDSWGIDIALLGAQGLDADTSGTLYLDDFASNNDGSEIGPVGNTYELSALDGIVLGDSSSKSLTIPLSVSDGVELGDNPSKYMTMPLSVSDGIELGDTPSILLDMILSAVDGLNLGDSPSVTGSSSIVVSDGIKLGDNPFLVSPKTVRFIKPTIILIRDKV